MTEEKRKVKILSVIVLISVIISISSTVAIRDSNDPCPLVDTFSCLAAVTQLDIGIDQSCIDADSGIIYLQIRTGSKSEDIGLKGIRVLLNSSNHSVDFEISNASVVTSLDRNIPKPGTDKFIQ